MDDEHEEQGTSRIAMPGGWGHLVKLSVLRLTATRGPQAGKKWSFDAPVVRIGKDPTCDLVLQDSAVSRVHAEVERTPRGVLLRDLESTNGTFVGTVRVAEVFLDADSTVRIGETELAVDRGCSRVYAVPTDADRLGEIVGASSAMREVHALFRAVAPTTVTVLIEGESGTGKEVAASTLHELSGRTGPLVIFDCASTSPELIRSELFGHASGAYTGAAQAREGAFRRANRGTLFIDELGELPLAMQPHLLRALESRAVQPLGVDRPVPVDVRVVLATNRNLLEMVRDGTFREDLYHRISVVPIRLPPLRERAEDIPLLLAHLSNKLDVSCRFTDAAMELILKHPWPGNIRALRNLVERTSVLCRDRAAGPADLRLPEPVAGAGPAPAGDLAQVERQAILKTLEQCSGHRTRAAERLGISESTLRRKLREYKFED